MVISPLKPSDPRFPVGPYVCLMCLFLGSFSSFSFLQVCLPSTRVCSLDDRNVFLLLSDILYFPLFTEKSCEIKGKKDGRNTAVNKITPPNEDLMNFNRYESSEIKGA